MDNICDGFIFDRKDGSWMNTFKFLKRENDIERDYSDEKFSAKHFNQICNKFIIDNENFAYIKLRYVFGAIKKSAENGFNYAIIPKNEFVYSDEAIYEDGDKNDSNNGKIIKCVIDDKDIKTLTDLGYDVSTESQITFGRDKQYHLYEFYIIKFGNDTFKNKENFLTAKEANDFSYKYSIYEIEDLIRKAINKSKSYIAIHLCEVHFEGLFMDTLKETGREDAEDELEFYKEQKYDVQDQALDYLSKLGYKYKYINVFDNKIAIFIYWGDILSFEETYNEIYKMEINPHVEEFIKGNRWQVGDSVIKNYKELIKQSEEQSEDKE